MKAKSALVVFGEEAPANLENKQFDEVIIGEKLKSLIRPGSIYRATELLEELPKVVLADGTPISESVMYKGYELWWIHTTDMFRYFCLPYTQFKPLLEYLRYFKEVYLHEAPATALLSSYLKAYGCEVVVLGDKRFRLRGILPFGVLMQILLTIISLPILMVRRLPLMVYTGDKFEKDQDFDFRMRFVYQELRKRKISFVEFIRGIEPWKNVLSHAWTRRRPAIYSEAVVFVSRFISYLTGGPRERRALINRSLEGESSPEARFRLLIAAAYIQTDEDVWATRIMGNIIRLIGIKVAFIPTASERTLQTVLGCKLNSIPTVGIMHGVQTRYYNPYDFLVGFQGEKRLTVDRFGVWSEWWKEYYLRNSMAFAPEQLFVSGPMRPLIQDDSAGIARSGKKIRLLAVSEEMAVPEEVLPYIEEVLKHDDFEVTLKFRPYRDGFEQWLLKHKPDLLDRPNLKIAKGSMQDAIKDADVAVGCQSTGVIEMLFQLKVPIYFRTEKWGDYFDLKGYDKEQSFFAESPSELVEKIRRAKSISVEALKDLRERYFGDPRKSGSVWVVNEAERFLNSKRD